jgi:uncharacterized Zn-binding protein involved in type VI secretion
MAVYLNCNSDNGRPAARLGDSVSCPKHGTASIISGSPDTRFDNMPAARVGDKTSCGDTLIEGSDTIYINGLPAAFVGCATAHGGKITSGSPTVFIGMYVDSRSMHEASAAQLRSLRWQTMSAPDATPSSGVDIVVVAHATHAVETFSSGDDGRTERLRNKTAPESYTALIGSGEWTTVIMSDDDPLMLEYTEWYDWEAEE